jgi:hypothetical protein
MPDCRDRHSRRRLSVAACIGLSRHHRSS